jgi:hypothetical protein
VAAPVAGRLRALGIDEVKTLPQGLPSHPFAERLIGTLRPDHLESSLEWITLQWRWILQLDTFMAFTSSIN